MASSKAYAELLENFDAACETVAVRASSSLLWLAMLTTSIGVGSCGLSCAVESDPPSDMAPASPDAGEDAPTPQRRPLAALWGAPTLPDENPDPEIVEVHLEARRARAVFDDKEIDVLAYNGVVPGPTLQARPRQRVIVHFENTLDEPTTVHWHGLRIPDAMDGSPRVQTPVPPGGTFTYTFTVPEAASFWYHPHVNTHAQLERGLYGAIVIQDDRDPIYDLERLLVLDDVLLDANGDIPPATLSGIDALTGRWGNVMLTNGRNAKLATATASKGQVERWRLFNTANARRMPIHVEGARVRLIGTDGGLLTTPIDVTSELMLPVGGRLDLEVSYETSGTARLVLSDGGTPVTMFAATVEDGPNAPREIPWPEVEPVIAERPATGRFDMTFDFINQGPSPAWTINGTAHWMDPILTVKQGSAMKMKLSSASQGVAHPFHMHGQFFRVLDEPQWPGLRDTVLVPENKPIEIITYFDNPGRWMAHCHILEHSELGMMAEILVTSTGAPAPSEGGPPAGHSHRERESSSVSF